jgi:AsmA protein
MSIGSDRGFKRSYRRLLGRSVTLGELHLHLIPFSIKVDGLSVVESPSFPSNRPFATAQEVYASAGLLSLIRGHPELHEITLSQPHIELIRNADGTWNFSTLGTTQPANASDSRPAGTSAPADPAGAPSTTSPPGSSRSPNSAEAGGGLTLNQLKITGGQVAVTDLKTKAQRTVYNNIDVALADFAPGKPFDLDVAIHFPGQGKELLSFKGKAGPLGANTQATPVDGQLSIEQVALAGLNSVASGTIPPNTDAMATGQAIISSGSGIVGVKGTLNLENAIVQGKKLNAPINAQYDLNTNQISITLR